MDTVGRDRLFKAKQHNLPIRVHLQKMYSKYLREVVQYPKIYKPTIGQDMRECFAALRTKINHAAKLQHKLTALREADTALECLRDTVWAALDVRCISEGQYGLWVEDLSALGMMLVGWIRDARNAEQKTPR